MTLRHAILARLVPLLAAVLVATGSTVFADRVLNPALLFLSGTIKIGINGALPGWSYPRDDDEADGFDVALAKFLQRKYEFTLDLVPLRPDQRKTELSAGRVDLVIANYSIDGSSWPDTDNKRLDVMDFAGPYFLDHSGVMYSEEKRSKVTSDETSIPVGNLCVSNGTTAAQDYLKGAGKSADQSECFRRFADSTDYDIVGVVTDQVILTTYTRKFYTGELQDAATASPLIWQNDLSNYPIHDERYGIAMPDNSPALCRELTSAINEFLENEAGWEQAFTDHLDGVGDRDEHKPDHADPRLC
jgi:glutamate transport system substrate-binding protein